MIKIIYFNNKNLSKLILSNYLIEILNTFIPNFYKVIYLFLRFNEFQLKSEIYGDIKLGRLYWTHAKLQGT